MAHDEVLRSEWAGQTEWVPAPGEIGEIGAAILELDPGSDAWALHYETLVSLMTHNRVSASLLLSTGGGGGGGGDSDSGSGTAGAAYTASPREKKGVEGGNSRNQEGGSGSGPTQTTASTGPTKTGDRLLHGKLRGSTPASAPRPLALAPWLPYRPQHEERHFGYNGQPKRADCMELVLRSICDLLVWDTASGWEGGRLDPSLLPPTAHQCPTHSLL